MRFARSLRSAVTVLSFACAAFAAPLMEVGIFSRFHDLIYSDGCYRVPPSEMLETGIIIDNGTTNAQDNTNSSISQRGIFHICSVTFDQASHVTEVATVDSKANDLAQQWVVRLLNEADKRMGLTFDCTIKFTNKYRGQLFAGNYRYSIQFHVEDDGKKPLCGSTQGGWGCSGSIRWDKSARFTHPYSEIQISRTDGEKIFDNSVSVSFYRIMTSSQKRAFAVLLYLLGLGKIGTSSTWIGAMDWSKSKPHTT
ncbi:hypothetical protein EV368DRAFT_87298 [Lentinula lateritia]|nr:hypothetical protein EV368DRAFT_87298 [Lentinula lateritia]